MDCCCGGRNRMDADGGVMTYYVIFLVTIAIRYMLAPIWMKSDSQKALDALSKVTNQKKLQKASTDSKYYLVRAQALKKMGFIQESQAELACNETDYIKGRKLIDGIDDQVLLSKIVNTSQQSEIIEYAFNRITDTNVLNKIDITHLPSTLKFDWGIKLNHTDECCRALSSLLLNKRMKLSGA